MEKLPLNDEKNKLNAFLYKSGAIEEFFAIAGDERILIDDVNSLAFALALNKEQLYSRYHNLFSFQKDKSAAFLQNLIAEDRKDLARFSVSSEEYKLLKNKIIVCEFFFDLAKKYSWTNCYKIVRFLEDYLK
jgi:hypothetical protein